MPKISAQEVKALRDATGAGILDAREALEKNGGDHEAAAKWLRERGKIKSADRAGRDNNEGAVAVAVKSDGRAAALVELKSETDFVAKSPQFVDVVSELAELVAERGEQAAAERKDAVDDLTVAFKENVELGKVARFEAGGDDVLDAYLHVQNDRGVNGVLVELAGGSADLAHDIALHIAFARPGFLSRDEVPPDAVKAERASLEAETRNEGKPEQAIPKIVEGKLNGWFKRAPGGVLLEQSYVRNEKQTVGQALGSAAIVRFAQVEIGR